MELTVDLSLPKVEVNESSRSEETLGIEGLEPFIQRAPLRRVPECVFGVLAIESEPVAPRL